MADEMVGAIRDRHHREDIPADIADTLPDTHNSFCAVFGKADIRSFVQEIGNDENINTTDIIQRA